VETRALTVQHFAVFLYYNSYRRDFPDILNYYGYLFYFQAVALIREQGVFKLQQRFSNCGKRPSGGAVDPLDGGGGTN
jgi:hypothetical protein